MRSWHFFIKNKIFKSSFYTNYFYSERNEKSQKTLVESAASHFDPSILAQSQFGQSHFGQVQFGPSNFWLFQFNPRHFCLSYFCPSKFHFWPKSGEPRKVIRAKKRWAKGSRAKMRESKGREVKLLFSKLRFKPKWKGQTVLGQFVFWLKCSQKIRSTK